jgi:hypothetical protein
LIIFERHLSQQINRAFEGESKTYKETETERRRHKETEREKEEKSKEFCEFQLLIKMVHLLEFSTTIESLIKR